MLPEIPHTFLKLKAPQSANTASRVQTEKVFSAGAGWCCCHCTRYNLKLVHNPCIIVKIIIEVSIGIEKDCYKIQGTDEPVLGGTMWLHMFSLVKGNLKFLKAVHRHLRGLSTQKGGE